MPILALMARRKPQSGQLSPERQALVEMAVSRALARNGDNTLLLDALQSNSEVISEFSATLGGIKADVAAIAARVGFVDERLKVVEPALWKLEDERQQKIGASNAMKKIGDVVTAGRVALVGAASAVTYAVTHWFPGGKGP